MNDFDTPIFRKTYDLYKTFYGYRADISKQDRYTIWQKCESLILEVLEAVLLAGHIGKIEKLPILESASSKLNLLRVFIRLMCDIKAIDNRKYLTLQSDIDEIGRMLGGWIKSSRER